MRRSRKANHADYICVPRNLLAKVPKDCDLQSAAMTTVGTIALQGVRRANPSLGETMLVLGLGLLGGVSFFFSFILFSILEVAYGVPKEFKRV